MRVLITGFTGTLGSQVVSLLLEDGHHVVGYSRDEAKQSAYLKHDNLTMYLGDVRDRVRLVEASRGVDLILHFAALKQVDKLELNPEESIKTNIVGTENVLHAQRVNKIPRILLSSTDKACYPINVYGYCKALSEKLILRNQNNIVTRYGNVLGSRGSVLPFFVKTLKEEGRIYITDKRMTRFFLTPEEAATFVVISAAAPVGGLRIPVMKAYPVAKMAIILAGLLDVRKPIIIETGIRPGEKLHENLRTESEGGELVSCDNKLWFSDLEMKELLKSALGI